MTWHGFDEIIDVRSPAEYAEDRIPGAVNLPVLSDIEHAEIGKLYKTSPFAARLRGAGLLASNISAHLQNDYSSRPPEWRPLVYCRRGGQRSGAVVEILQRIGWKAQSLKGGYKQYRQEVITNTQKLAPTIQWTVVGGKTGAGKTELLRVLKDAGESVIDLEALGNHRGSAFGGNGAQPSQRLFESHLFAELSQLPRNRPVFVEAEGRKIGKLHVPQPVLSAMRCAPLFYLRAALSARARRIVDDYSAMKDPKTFDAAIETIGKYAGAERREKWRQQHADGQWETLASDLLESFYDIGYQKSLSANYTPPAARFSVNPNCQKDMQKIAREIARAADGGGTIRI